MLLIGLTGNIASGKTSVAEIWKQLGASIIDADAIGHEVIQKDSEAYVQLIEHFGSSIVDDDEEINRRELAKRVFGNDNELKILNEIVHPPLLQRMDEYVDMEWKKGTETVVVDAALLFEFGLTDLFDVIVIVDADEKVRTSRVEKKRNISEEEALKIVRSQMDPRLKKKEADYVLTNNDGLDQLKEEAVKLFAKINRENSM